MGPEPSNIIHKDVKFTSKYTFPYTFSMLVSNTEHGKSGEGNYEVRIFLKDLNASLSMLNASDKLGWISLL